MELENIIESLKSEIEYEKNGDNDLDNISWPNQDGILIAVNDLEKIIKACEGNQANSENANCAIFDVSKQSELLIDFLKWRKGEQLTSETITEIDNFLADKSNL